MADSKVAGAEDGQFLGVGARVQHDDRRTGSQLLAQVLHVDRSLGAPFFYTILLPNDDSSSSDDDDDEAAPSAAEVRRRARGDEEVSDDESMDGDACVPWRASCPQRPKAGDT